MYLHQLLVYFFQKHPCSLILWPLTSCISLVIISFLFNLLHSTASFESQPLPVVLLNMMSCLVCVALCHWVPPGFRRLFFTVPWPKKPKSARASQKICHASCSALTHVSLGTYYNSILWSNFFPLLTACLISWQFSPGIYYSMKQKPLFCTPTNIELCNRVRNTEKLYKYDQCYIKVEKSNKRSKKKKREVILAARQ